MILMRIVHEETTVQTLRPQRFKSWNKCWRVGLDTNMAGAQEWAPAVASLVNEGAYAVLEAATKLEKEGKNIVHFEIGQPG